MAPPNPRPSHEVLRNPPATHSVSSRSVVSGAGRGYRVFIAMPKAASGKGFAALYMLDGNAAFDALSADQLARYPELAVIGIGYEVETSFDFEARSFDYTPMAKSGAGVPSGQRRPARASGGAPVFLDVLRDEIVAPLEGEFPLDARRRTLWGQSYGGLFALYALAHAGDFFRGYAIASPSLWWDGGAIIDDVERALERLPPMAVDLSRGDGERPSDGSEIDARTPFARLAAAMERAAFVTCAVRVFEGAGHRSVLDLSLPFALELAAAPIDSNGGQSGHSLI